MRKIEYAVLAEAHVHLDRFGLELDAFSDRVDGIAHDALAAGMRRDHGITHRYISFFTVL